MQSQRPQPELPCAIAKAGSVTRLENERRKKTHLEFLSLFYFVCPFSYYFLDLLEFVFLNYQMHTQSFSFLLFCLSCDVNGNVLQFPVSLYLSPSLNSVSLGGLCWIRVLCSFFTALLHCII